MSDRADSDAASPYDQDLLRLIGGPDGCPTNSVTDQRLRELDIFLRTGFRRGLDLAWRGPIVTYEDARMKQISAEAHLPADRVARVTLHPAWMPFAGLVAAVLDMVLPPDFAERAIEAEVVGAYAAEQVESAPSLTADRFASAIIGAIQGDAGFPDLPVPDAQRETERTHLLRSAADAFVVGHEYAHIMLGHLGDEAPSGLDTFQIEHITDMDRHRQERQADVASLMAVSWALVANNYPPTIASVGALVFFALQAGIEVARPKLTERGVAPAVDVAGVYPDVRRRMDSALEELEADGKADVTRCFWEYSQPAIEILLARTEELSAA